MKKQGEMDLDAYPFTVRKLTAEEVRLFGGIPGYTAVPIGWRHH